MSPDDDMYILYVCVLFSHVYVCECVYLYVSCLPFVCVCACVCVSITDWRPGIHGMAAFCRVSGGEERTVVKERTKEEADEEE